MNYGLQRLKELPLSLRLIREIHGELMRGVRGGNRDLGEFRGLDPAEPRESAESVGCAAEAQENHRSICS